MFGSLQDRDPDSGVRPSHRVLSRSGSRRVKRRPKGMLTTRSKQRPEGLGGHCLRLSTCMGVVFLAGAGARAQNTLGDPAPIQNLAVDSHGSTLYFTTSLRQRGTSQSAISKVFALSSAGLQLVEQSSFNSLR